MKFFSALNVFWMLTVATASAGQYSPDFTGDRRADSPGFFEALSAAAPAADPSKPEKATVPAYFGTEGYNPNQDRENSPESDGAIAKNVFSGNKRGKVTSTQYPWSAIGRLEVPGGICTASMVGPDLILTNAHCVVDEAKNDLKAGTIIFRPNYTDGTSAYSSEVSYAWWGSSTPSTNKRGDWAILRLKESLGDKVGWLGSKFTPNLNSTAFYAVGYSGDFENSNSASWETGCSFTGGVYSYGLAPHNCSNSRGASGGPMFVFEDTKPNIIAIHTSELRYDGDSTYIAVPYAADKANLALPSDSFTWKIAELRKPKQ